MLFKDSLRFAWVYTFHSSFLSHFNSDGGEYSQRLLFNLNVHSQIVSLIKRPIIVEDERDIQTILSVSYIFLKHVRISTSFLHSSLFPFFELVLRWKPPQSASSLRRGITHGLSNDRKYTNETLRYNF